MEEYNDDAPSDSLADRFESFSDEYLEFERIPKKNRLHPSKVLCGYLKVASLMLDGREFGVAAEHDIVRLPGADELVPLSDDDIIYLQRCGIHYDSENDCLADFC